MPVCVPLVMDQLKSNSDEESSHSVPIYRQNGTLTPADGWSGAGWLRSTPLMACPVPPFPNLSVPSPVPPMELSRLQCSSIPTNDGKNPKCLVGRRGTITVLMEKEVMVEITDDRNIRLLRLGRFALTSCSDPRRAALHHPKAQVYQVRA